MNRLLLRLEGLAALAVAAYGFREVGGAWLWFFVCFFAPDLAMLGYLGGKRAGDLAYGVVHSFFWPLAMGGAGYLLQQPLLLQGGLIWAAHVGLDRMLGFGPLFEPAAKAAPMRRAS